MIIIEVSLPPTRHKGQVSQLPPSCVHTCSLALHSLVLLICIGGLRRFLTIRKCEENYMYMSLIDFAYQTMLTVLQ